MSLALSETKEVDKMFQDGLIYQDSYMCSEEEFVKGMSSFQLSSKGNEAFGKGGGPVLFRQGDTVYTDPGDAHSLYVGDTGSMKTLRFILPLIYSSAMAEESMVIVDPKGELARKTHQFLRDKGYEVNVLNLRHPQDSPDKWNPFSEADKLYKSGPDGRRAAPILLSDFCHQIFFSKAEKRRDPYWNESAGQLALGLLELIQASGEDLTMKNLLNWRYVKLPDGTVEECFQKLDSNSEVYQNLAGYMSLTADTTQSCILSSFDQLVRIFKLSTDLTDLLSTTTFDISQIGEKKKAVFLIVPDEKTTLHVLATLFIQQCYTTLLDKAEEYEGRLPKRVNFILEEFCNMPKLSDLVAMLTAARSRNIRFHLVIQSYGQVVDKYGENVSKTILDNCGNLIYLHTREISFLEYISKLAGRNEYGRPLLSPSRLQRLKKNETLIFHDRCYPFLTQDIPLIFEYPIELGKTLPKRKKAYLKRKKMSN